MTLEQCGELVGRQLGTSFLAHFVAAGMIVGVAMSLAVAAGLRLTDWWLDRRFSKKYQQEKYG